MKVLYYFYIGIVFDIVGNMVELNMINIYNMLKFVLKLIVVLISFVIDIVRFE